MKIIFRGGEVAGKEQEYIDKFANPFPAAQRGRLYYEGFERIFNVLLKYFCCFHVERMRRPLELS